MNVVLVAAREVAGLFVDDGALTLRVAGVVVAAAIAAIAVPAYPLAAGGILLFGCLAVLCLDAAGARRRAPS